MLMNFSCKNKPSDPPTVSAKTVESEIAAVPVMEDSTVYVHTLESGMSTFLCVTDSGDTLELDRGQNLIYGNLDKAGDRFAITIDRSDKNYPAVGRAINLSNLDALTKDYKIVNGQLVLKGDTVEIIDLTTNKLVAKGKKEYTLTK